MIVITVKPRQDNLYDAYIGDQGDHFFNSNQGYANVEDVENIVRRCWPRVPTVSDLAKMAVAVGLDIPRGHIEAVRDMLASEPVVMVTNYRDGRAKTEQLR